MIRVLVTGGAGYVGSHTAKALAQAGMEPVAYDNLFNGKRELVKWGPLVEGDIADADRLAATLERERIDAVIHMAGRIEVGPSMRDPATTYRVNLVGSLSLLDAMRRAGVRPLVFSSTAAVYGTPRQVPIPEDHPLDPVNPYGASKLAVERAIGWYAQAYDMAYACLRYFNACGADPDGETGESHDPETHLIPLVLRAGLGQSAPVKLFGSDYPTPDGTAMRDYIHVSDLADAHVLALRRLLDGGDSLIANLGTGRGYSVRQILDTATQALGQPIPHQVADRRAGDPPELVADPSRANQILDWTPSRSDLATILQTAAAWHRRGERPWESLKAY